MGNGPLARTGPGVPVVPRANPVRDQSGNVIWAPVEKKVAKILKGHILASIIHSTSVWGKKKAIFIEHIYFVQIFCSHIGISFSVSFTRATIYQKKN